MSIPLRVPGPGVLHFNVTPHPTARWVIQQLREAFPEVPSYRYLIFDNDAIFSDEVVRSIASFGIEPRRTAFRNPWQNGTAERFVGTVRRELLDHVVVLARTTRGACSGSTWSTPTPIASTHRLAIRPGASLRSEATWAPDEPSCAARGPTLRRIP
jgi:transposase InsO family protein